MQDAGQLVDLEEDNDTKKGGKKIDVEDPFNLGDISGVVACSQNKFLQSMCRFKVSALPPGKTVASHPGDPSAWKPSTVEMLNLESLFFAKEETPCFIREALNWLGISRLRPLQLRYMVDPSSGDAYVVRREFRLGRACGCPLSMDLYKYNGEQPVFIGRVIERWQGYLSNCFETCCLCTVSHDIQERDASGTFHKRYTLRASLACCGRVNNCYAPTCCREEAVYDILDTSGVVVAHLTRVYGSGHGCDEGCSAFFRFCQHYDNYILEFPQGSTPDQRILLITSIFQLDVQFRDPKD